MSMVFLPIILVPILDPGVPYVGKLCHQQDPFFGLPLQVVQGVGTKRSVEQVLLILQSDRLFAAFPALVTCRLLMPH